MLLARTEKEFGGGGGGGRNSLGKNEGSDRGGTAETVDFVFDF